MFLGCWTDYELPGPKLQLLSLMCNCTWRGKVAGFGIRTVNGNAIPGQGGGWSGWAGSSPTSHDLGPFPGACGDGGGDLHISDAVTEREYLRLLESGDGGAAAA